MCGSASFDLWLFIFSIHGVTGGGMETAAQTDKVFLSNATPLVGDGRGSVGFDCGLFKF